MKYTRKLTPVLLLASLAAAQTSATTPAEVRNLNVLRSRNELKLELTLSQPVQPIVTLARDPDRLVLDLPNTASAARQERRSIDQGGVKSVRMGLNSTNPLVTRMVIDLDQARPYGVNANGNKITLTVLLSEQDAKGGPRKGAPVPAASGPLLGRLHRNPQSTISDGEKTVSVPPVTPPPALPPLKLPETQASASRSSSNPVTSPPSAAHPNYGSLQQGTVFPNAGAPGTGAVPVSTGNVAVGQLNPAANPEAKEGLNQVSNGGAFSSANSAVTKPIAPSISATTVASTSSSPAPSASTPVSPTNTHTQLPSKQALKSAQASTTTTVVSKPADQSPVPAGTIPVVADSSTNTGATADESMPMLAARQPNSDLHMSFRVKYVPEGAAYLEGGRSSGLTEGMKLEVRDITVSPEQDKSAAQNAPVVAELDVISVAETSAVTEIHVPKRDVKPGDFAFLSTEDTETLVAQRSLSATRKYPAVISFTDVDPLDEEAREDVPRPPLPEINRARGRFGFDYSSVVSQAAFSSRSSSTGIILRTDITRIGGTYWNLNGYWRGRLTSSSGGQQTIQDLINRTYTLGLTYDNPRSTWVAGFGRLYLPYATSLDTIDGGFRAARWQQRDDRDLRRLNS
jgi:AMIN domain